MEEITYQDFERIEMRVGTITEASVFEAARKPAYQIIVDLGPYGLKKTSAQITQLYSPEELIGRQVIVVVNFPPKQIANMMSECLVLGAIDEQLGTVLLSAERQLSNGSRIA